MSNKRDPDQARLLRRLRENAGPGRPAQCPDGHGDLWRWHFSGAEWHCSHIGHGGNGRFFTDAEVER